MQVYARVPRDGDDYEWQRGRVLRHFEADGATPMAEVRLENGSVVEVNEAMDVRMANGSGDGDGVLCLAEVENLDSLTHLHEASFVDYLKERYAVNHVYCRSGTVLIAVNPFKNIEGLYDMDTYQQSLRAQQEGAHLPPHVFSMAESAYQSLRRKRRLKNADKMNQTILVSGESGAGKTESTKFIMQYLATASSARSTNGSGGVAVDAHDHSRFLLSANPVLESFGNARTLRNDNSSRFGKFVRMFFEEDAMHMVSTSVDTYLLERVRVVHQGLGERNFHAFYELLKGASDPLREALKLGDLEAKDFEYVNVGQCFVRNDGVDDARQFARTSQAMNVIGFSAEEQNCIWKVVSALLHLGNVGFVPPVGHEDEDPANSPPCEPSSESVSSMSAREHLAVVASLCQVDESSLSQTLTVRMINVGGEKFQMTLSQAQCTDARDAMARSLYGWVFQYLVRRVNGSAPSKPAALPTETDTRPCISVLDIFGFEEFDENQFEQFCINYANEKLQYQFIKDILETEQDAHIQEGITWNPVDYEDNGQCLDLIEQRPGGILSLLDEECLVPKGSDASFARKMYLQMKQHPSFVASNTDQVDVTFQVQHYAGQVRYHATGFCEKNKDQPNADLLGLLLDTKDPDLQVMFQDFKDAEEPSSKQLQDRPKIRRRASVIGAVGIGSQFKQQLANLLEVVQLTQTHYIRCIKPNDLNVKDVFHMSKVARQLRYGGVLKAIEIMRQSYPVRMPHEEFLERYRLLAPKDLNINVVSLLKELSAEGIEVGTTRVFVRQAAFDRVEKARDMKLSSFAVLIQSHWKMERQRQIFVRSLELLRSIQLRWRAIIERKRRLTRRLNAVRCIQRTIRMWQNHTRNVKEHAAAKIQRLSRAWIQAKSTETNAAVITAEHSTATYSVAKSPYEAPPLATITASSWRARNVASSVAGSETFSDADTDTTVDGCDRISSGRIDSDFLTENGTLLKRAVDELERLRARAEVAEAALAQITSGADPRALRVGRTGSKYRIDNITGTDQFGSTMLHIAAETGEPEDVYELLMKDPSAMEMLNRTETQRGYTPLHAAVRRGSVNVIGIFFRPDVLPNVDLNAMDRDGNSPLHLAVQLNDELSDRVMELLLCLGADPNVTNYHKQTPLHLCSMVKRSSVMSADLVEKLLRYGAQPNPLDLLKRTPLFYCVDKGIDDAAVVLMKHGGDMNIPDAEGVRVVSHPKAIHLLQFMRATPSWIPDADVASCMICEQEFSYFFGRKCHCERCGRVCCTECCPSSSTWNGRFCFDCKHYEHVP